MLDANVGNAPDGDVVLGRIDADGHFVADATAAATAVHVNVERTDLPTYFAQAAFGTPTMSAGGRATAVAGGPSSSECPLPIAVPSCQLDAAADVCNLDIVFNSDGVDNAGWALPGSSRPNANALRNAITSCTAAATTVDVISLNNGSVNAAMIELASAVSASPDRWSASWGTQPTRSARSGISVPNYGKVLLRELVVYDDPKGCTDPKYNALGVPVRGFATAAIYDVETSGPVASRNIRMRVLCGESEERGGGGFYGTTSAPQFVSGH